MSQGWVDLLQDIGIVILSVTTIRQSSWLSRLSARVLDVEYPKRPRP